MATMTEQAVSKEQGLKLELTRVIRASRESVFNAWIRPEFIRQWFGPAEKTCNLAELDPRVGGAYTVGMSGEPCDIGKAAEKGIHMNPTSRATGRYIKVDSYDLLQFTGRATGSRRPRRRW